MTVLDRTKYDLAINGQGYRAVAVNRDTAGDFAPRFNTGEQGENDLDLFKSKTLKSLAGGMLQNDWDDDEMVSTALSVVFNPLDNHTYPAPEAQALYNINHNASGGVPPTKVHTAWAVYDGVLYIAVRDYLSGTGADGNLIYAMPSSGGTVNTGITLPAALRDADPITDMHVYKNKIYIATGANSGGVGIYAMTPNTGTPASATFATHGSSKGRYLATLNNKLYFMIGGSGLYINSTGTTWTRVTDVGNDSETTNTLAVTTFQGRIYISKEDGLYAYDGVTAYLVLDNEGYDNGYGSMCEYRGWLYLLNDTGLARFNGVTYEFLYPLTSLGTPMDRNDLVVANDRLYFALTFAYDPIDTTIGTTLTASVDEFGLFYYDGVGLFCYSYYTHTNTDLDILMSAFGEPHIGQRAQADTVDTVLAYWPKEWEFSLQDSGATFFEYVINTSVFDGNFPNVKKILHGLDLDYLVSTDADVEVEGDIWARYTDENGTWSSWTQLAAITDKTMTNVTLETPIAFYSLQISIDSESSRSALRRMSLRWTLHPRKRSRWNVEVVTMGSDSDQIVKLKDESYESATTATLRSKLLQAEKTSLPVWFTLDISDQLNGAINDSVGTLTCDSTALFPPEGRFVIEIGSEKIIAEYLSATTLTLHERGAYGTTPASHSDNAQIDQVHRVYIERILNERYLHYPINQATTHVMDTSIQLQLVEV